MSLGFYTQCGRWWPSCTHLIPALGRWTKVDQKSKVKLIIKWVYGQPRICKIQSQNKSIHLQFTVIWTCSQVTVQLLTKEYLLLEKGTDVLNPRVKDKPSSTRSTEMRKTERVLPQSSVWRDKVSHSTLYKGIIYQVAIAVLNMSATKDLYVPTVKTAVTASWEAHTHSWVSLSFPYSSVLRAILNMPLGLERWPSS